MYTRQHFLPAVVAGDAKAGGQSGSPSPQAQGTAHFGPIPTHLWPALPQRRPPRGLAFSASSCFCSNACLLFRLCGLLRGCFRGCLPPSQRTRPPPPPPAPPPPPPPPATRTEVNICSQGKGQLGCRWGGQRGGSQQRLSLLWPRRDALRVHTACLHPPSTCSHPRSQRLFVLAWPERCWGATTCPCGCCMAAGPPPLVCCRMSTRGRCALRDGRTVSRPLLTLGRRFEH